MKYCLLSVFILSTLLLEPAQAEPAVSKPPDLASLYQKVGANQLLLVTFTDQSINSIPDSAAASFYRKRGAYQSTSWSQRISENIAEDHHLIKLTEWPMTEVGMHCVVYQVQAPELVANAMQQLARDVRVEIVQKMNYFTTQSQPYNDPYFKLQANILQMQVDEVHAKTTGQGVNIALIDTGVALDHPDLQDQIAGNQNFAKAISSSFSTDKHGTAVAGIMVAQKNNNIGIVGVAPGASVLALKACWPDQPENMASVCNSLTLALAINAAIKAKVNIINMSLSGPEDPLLMVLLNAAIEQGILIVAAVASDTTSESTSFPASLENVIAVKTAASSHSNTPPPLNTVTAPGENILTTLPQGGYDFISGSSIATAEVSGILALLLELKPDLTLTEAQQILKKSTLAHKSNPKLEVNANTAVLAVCELTLCPQETVSLALGHLF